MVDRIVEGEDMETSVPDPDFADEEVEFLLEDEQVDEDEPEIAGVLELEDVEPEVEDTLMPIDDLSQPIFVEPEPEPVKTTRKKKPAVVVVRPAEESAAAAEEEAKRKKRKPLVYNEELDQVVVDRKRKGGKIADQWIDEIDDDLDVDF